jgi:hypothetical protein
MAGRVRAAASSVGARKNLKSSSFRGSDFLGIGSATRSAESTFWVEQAGFRKWAVGLGMATVSGPAFDWQLMLEVDNSDPVSVAISTPAVLTKDGAQVHKDEYLELRELLIAGLTAPSAPNVELEAATGKRGLEFVRQPFAGEPLTPFDGEFLISAAASPSQSVDLLCARLHYRHSGEGPTGHRWLLGLGEAAPRSWVDLSTQSARSGCELTFAVHLNSDAQSAVTNLITTNHAKRFAGYALSVMRELDKGASLAGGGALTNGID